MEVFPLKYMRSPDKSSLCLAHKEMVMGGAL